MISSLSSRDVTSHISSLEMESDVQDFAYARVDQTPAKPLCLMLTFVGVLVVIAGGGIIVLWLAYDHGMSLGIASLRKIQPPLEVPLPMKWSVASEFLVPWVTGVEDGLGFTTCRHLEAIYSKQGFKDGHLQSSQFLQLSQASIASVVKSFCASHDDSMYCTEHVDEMAFWKEDLWKTPQIPIMAEGLAGWESPLTVTVNEVQVATEIAQLKQLLLYSARPLLLSLPRLWKKIWIECMSDSVELCKQRMFKCVHDESKFCYPKLFDIGSQWIDDEIYETFPRERTILSVVGYVDDMGSDGNIIVRNNWGAVGHTFDYLMGQLPLDLDRKACPDPTDSSLWIPVILNCTEGEDCTVDVNGATELSCIDTAFCEANIRYYLHSGDLDDIRRPGIVGIVDNQTLVDVLPLPFEFAAYGLRPVGNVNVPIDRCGYVSLPYKVVNAVSGMQHGAVSGWRAYNIDVTWSADSYGKTSTAFNYSAVEQSMRYYYMNTSDLWQFDPSEL